jgi:hypothetical protein
MPTFKEWLKEKADSAPEEQRKKLLQDWTDAYSELAHNVREWLQDDEAGRVRFGNEPITRSEEGLGSYQFSTVKIIVGDQSVDVVPVARNVIAHVGDPPTRAAGRVDITNGIRKYALYRVVRDGNSTWRIVKDATEIGDLSRQSLEEIIMDLMS